MTISPDIPEEEFFQPNTPLKVVAHKYGVTIGVILARRRKLIAAGGRRLRIPWSPADDAQLLKLRASGASIAECVRVLGRTQNGVRNRLHRLRAKGVT